MESAPPPDVGQAIKEGVKRMDVPDPLKTVLPDKNSGFNILSQASISLSDNGGRCKAEFLGCRLVGDACALPLSITTGLGYIDSRTCHMH